MRTASHVTFLRGARQKAIDKLQQAYDGWSHEGDFELQTLEEIVRNARAILTTNAEIWERCQQNRVNASSGEMLFKRLIYDRIILENDTTASTLKANAVSVFSIRDFGKLPTMPDELTSIIAFPIDMKAGQQLSEHAYENYFETALVLHEDVLLPFLVRYKEFLKTLQVFLGEIDKWILEVEFRSVFLAKTFGVTPEPLSLHDVQPSMCFTEEAFRPPRASSHTSKHLVSNKPGRLFDTLTPNSSCMKCYRSYKEHRQQREYKDNYPLGKISVVKYQCKGGGCGEFFKPQICFLKQYRSGGEYNQSFQLATDLDLSLVESFFAFAEKQSVLLSSVQSSPPPSPPRPSNSKFARPAYDSSDSD